MKQPQPVLAFLLVAASAATQEAPEQAPVPAPASKAPEPRRPNAADLYLAAASTLAKSLEVESAYEIELPEELADDPRARRYENKAWDDLIAKSGSELSVFAAAARTAECAFAVDEGGLMLIVEELVVPLQTLAQSTAANGFRRLREGAFDVAVVECTTLLSFARHLGAQPSMVAVFTAGQNEVCGLSLLRAVLESNDPRAAKAKQRAQIAFADHVRLRKGASGAAAGVREQVRRSIQTMHGQTPGTPAEREAPPSDRMRILRENVDAIATRVDRHLEEWLAPLVADDGGTLEERLARVEVNRKAMRKRARELGSLEVAKKNVEGDPLEVVAEVVFALVAANPSELVRCEMFAREEIAACQRVVENGVVPAKR